MSESEYSGYNERNLEDGLVDYRIPASKCSWPKIEVNSWATDRNK